MKKIVILFLLIPFITQATVSNTNVDDPFILASSAFQNKGVYPKLYSCDSLGISPTLNWSNVPAGTKSFAITMHHFLKTEISTFIWFCITFLVMYLPYHRVCKVLATGVVIHKTEI